MAKNLLIVESPAKAKTIEGYLGKDFLVKSSYGHIRDLVKGDIGIDIENDFSQTYEVPADKKAVVAEDPKEKGLRKILNFGHTLGHAVETYLLGLGKRAVLHGEAIAVGMITEAYLAYQRNLIEAEELEAIEAMLFATYGRIQIKAEEIPAIIQLTSQDKKNKGSEIRFSLLTGIGDCGYDIPMTKAEMKKALEYYIG